ncbi:MAG: TonB-dependent receptor [Acidobacteria bacterium]|nr:TonB-dependent receptor [Acidobacteriota bacterium]
MMVVLIAGMNLGPMKLGSVAVREFVRPTIFQMRKVNSTMTQSKSVKTILLLLLLLAPFGVSLAQLPTATMLGSVKDSSGAVIPGSALTVRNLETGLTRTAEANADGSYRFSALPVGDYELRVEHAGFRAEVRSGLTLSVGQEAVVNLSLQVGAIEQTVEVTAEAPLVNTTSGTLGVLVDQQKVADLPLNGRNYVDLAFLQPGVQAERRTGGGPVMAGQFFSSNGAPPRSNNFMLDGAMMQSTNDTATASGANETLGVEGIREFRMVTNSFSAEYGMRMGSQMTLVSKNGTNTFHGSLFEYLRNAAFDARNFFDRLSGQPTSTSKRRLPGFSRNQAGASFGGPIMKDHTFFFLTYEFLAERLGRTLTFNSIPGGCKVTGATCAGPQGTFITGPISPVARPIVDLYPEPNLPNRQYTYPFSQPNDQHYGQIRMDQNFSASDNLFGRYTVDSGQFKLAGGLDGYPDERPSRSQFGTISETHIFSSTLLNTFRYSYSRTYLNSFRPTETGPQFDLSPGLGLGSIQVAGVSNVGQSTLLTTGLQNVFTWSDDLFYTKGPHSFKFGTLINRYQPYLVTGSDARGTVAFASVAALHQAVPNSYRAVTAGSIMDRTTRFSTFGLYIQDDLRMNSKLTLNLGFRYEFHSNFVETHGHSSAFRNIAQDAAPTVGEFIQNPSKKNFSPRFGFAYDVLGDGKTAVRGGFGLLYDVASGFNTVLRVGPPFNTISQVNTVPILPALTFTVPLNYNFNDARGSIGNSARVTDYHVQQPHMLQYNLTVERQLPYDMGFTVAYAGSRGLNLLQAKEGNPSYTDKTVGGRKFYSGTEPRINPRWATIEYSTAAGSSWYNSLQTSLQKRIAHGLQFQSSFTWSKVLDDTQQLLSGDTSSYQADPDNPRLDRGPAGFDVTANWRFNAIYKMPNLVSSNGVLGKLVNGWWMSGIVSTQTGFATTVKVAGNRSRSQNNNAFGGFQDRPDLADGRNTKNMTSGTTAGCNGVEAGQKLGTSDRYFDPCAFVLQPAGFLGNASRGVLRSPGLATLDFSLSKDTSTGYLGEQGKLEFRMETFNLLNRVNFAQDFSTNVFSGSPTTVDEPRLLTAGQLTATRTTSRQIQFALKLIF